VSKLFKVPISFCCRNATSCEKWWNRLPYKTKFKYQDNITLVEKNQKKKAYKGTFVFIWGDYKALANNSGILHYRAMDSVMWFKSI
jgi:hypothetical protein